MPVITQTDTPACNCVASEHMVLVCSRQIKATKLTYKQGVLDKARKQPDPRQKAPELQKAIQNCSWDILKMVRFPAPTCCCGSDRVNVCPAHQELVCPHKCTLLCHVAWSISACADTY